MKFQKGVPRPANAGRKKGSKNKLKKVADALSAAGVDPVKEIMRLLKSHALDPKDEMKAWFELLSYCEAKPKEAEGDDTLDEGDDLIDDEENAPTAKLLDFVKTNSEAT